MNRLQANNGLIFRSEIEGLTGPDYSVFDVQTKTNAEFIAKVLRTSFYKDHFRSVATGLGTGTSGFLRLYDDDLLRTVVFLPDREEQINILKRTDELTNKLSIAINRTEREIKLLDEYKNRLVSDVVTGKLDVRQAAAELPEIDRFAEADVTHDADFEPDTDLEELNENEEVEV